MSSNTYEIICIILTSITFIGFIPSIISEIPSIISEVKELLK